MSRRISLLKLYVFAITIVTAVAVDLDMCASFTLEFEEKSIYLVTPRYGVSNYPNNSVCSCDITTIRATAQPRSLNVTIVDLNLEPCSPVAGTQYDAITLRTAHKFQSLYQFFTLCGTQPNLELADSRDNLYGVDSTLFSLGAVKISFQSDQDRSAKGARLKITSHRGIRVSCDGTSGPLPTTTVPPSTKTNGGGSSGGGGLSRLEEERARKKQQETIAGSLVGVVLTILAICAAAFVIIVIRRRKCAKDRSTPNNNVEDPNDLIYYKDPCQGRPSLPMPSDTNNHVSESYLYMKDGVKSPTTPIYAEPKLLNDAIYENEEAVDDEQEYQSGYIIPENPSSVKKSTTGAMKVPKAAVQFKLQEPKKPAAVPRSKVEKTLSETHKPLIGTSSQNSSDDEYENGSLGSPDIGTSPDSNVMQDTKKKEGNSIYEPTLVKPSQMKNKGLSVAKPPPVMNKPLKPAIKAKPNLSNQSSATGKIPPPPPSKAAKPKFQKSERSGEPYQLVNIETSN